MKLLTSNQQCKIWIALQNIFTLLIYNSFRMRVLSETDGESSEPQSHRRPFHYSGSQANIATSDPSEEAQYRRFQYYNRLQNQTGINLDVLVGIGNKKRSKGNKISFFSSPFLIMCCQYNFIKFTFLGYLLELENKVH